MNTAVVTMPQPRVLGDLISRSRLHDVQMILGGALFVGLLAQISIPLSFTPVPVTGQTLAVLLVGASFGPVRSALSMSLYLVAGLAGVPWFTQHSGGWHVVHGATFGYLLGFIVAGAVGGWLATRRADRKVMSAVASMVLSSAIIYILGVTWLGFNLGVSPSQAIAWGFTPFWLGDLIKAGIAGVALPATWKLLKR
jgi:biotin transport system substrate-specific component